MPDTGVTKCSSGRNHLPLTSLQVPYIHQLGDYDVGIAYREVKNDGKTIRRIRRQIHGLERPTDHEAPRYFRKHSTWPGILLLVSTIYLLFNNLRPAIQHLIIVRRVHRSSCLLLVINEQLTWLDNARVQGSREWGMGRPSLPWTSPACASRQVAIVRIAPWAPQLGPS